MSAPIIFCHYGNSEYLPYVIEAAKMNNPDKEIFFLGDETNQWLGNRYPIHHCFFRDFQYGEEIELFDQSYQLIQGRSHNNIKWGEDWVNFVFKRWFYVYNLIFSKGITRFWHFDSDNMILDSLTCHEAKFKGYDCTEQCNGKCMNGFIANPSVVLGYIRKINGLFRDRHYLNAMQKEFDEVNPRYAFTEMRAYEAFKEEKRIRSIRLNTIIDDSTFDDCICQEHGMAMEKLPFSKRVKKVYLSRDGGFYCREIVGNRLIRMISLNLSWVPIYLYKTVLFHAKRRTGPAEHVEPDIKSMPTLCSKVPRRYIVQEQIRRIVRFLRRI